MKMVAHQNEAKNRHVESLSRGFDKLHKLKLVSLAREDPLSRITASKKMIDRTLKLEP